VVAAMAVEAAIMDVEVVVEEDEYTSKEYAAFNPEQQAQLHQLCEA
jgi:hypothetical protein